jgi:hypothetical protein
MRRQRTRSSLSSSPEVKIDTRNKKHSNMNGRDFRYAFGHTSKIRCMSMRIHIHINMLRHKIFYPHFMKLNIQNSRRHKWEKKKIMVP